MKRLIHDVTHPRHIVKQVPDEVLIAELYQRGVTIKQIFRQFYAMEENDTHTYEPLTLADAELAGEAKLPVQPIDKTPF